VPVSAYLVCKAAEVRVRTTILLITTRVLLVLSRERVHFLIDDDIFVVFPVNNAKDELLFHQRLGLPSSEKIDKLLIASKVFHLNEFSFCVSGVRG